MTYMILRRKHNPEGGISGQGHYYWVLTKEEFAEKANADACAKDWAKRERTAFAVAQVRSVFTPATTVEEKTPANFVDNMPAWRGEADE